MVRIPHFTGNAVDLETLDAEQLFGLFDAYLKTRAAPIPYADFAAAWGHLFSRLDLAPAELLNEMESGGHPLGEAKERILREFIRADCRKGGEIVLSIIRKGGNLDRAALIMLSDGADLAALVSGSTTALHLLAEVCDRSLRPALIRRAGKRALGEMFDSRGLPPLFTILSLNDIRKEDLNAIGQVFTRDELAHVRNRNRTGRSILEAYTEISQKLKGRVPGERNAFMVTRAVKSTRLRPERPDRRSSGPQHPCADIFGETGSDEGPDAGQGYRDLISPSPDSIGKMPRKKPDGRPR